MKFFSPQFQTLCLVMLILMGISISQAQQKPNTQHNINTTLQQEYDARIKADSFFYQQEYEKAIHWYNISLEIIPHRFESLYNKACAFAKLGNTEEALHTLTQAVFIHNYAVDLAKDDPDFKSIRETQIFQELLQWEQK